MPQVFLTEEDVLAQRLACGSNKAFCVGVEIRRLRWQLLALHAAAFEKVAKRPRKERIAIVDEVVHAAQKTIAGIGDSSGALGACPQVVASMLR